MTADELVEKVARELCARNGDDPDEMMLDPDTGGEIANWTVYAFDARAAIAIVVEACAKVASEPYGFDIDVWMDSTKVEMASVMAKSIAAAICSLSPSSGSTGGENGK